MITQNSWVDLSFQWVGLGKTFEIAQLGVHFSNAFLYSCNFVLNLCFPAFGLNMEIYRQIFVNHLFQFESGRIQNVKFLTQTCLTPCTF